MKKNPYLYVLLLIFFVLSIEFGIIQWCLKTTRLYPTTEIVLSLKSDKLNEQLPQKISEDSIEELQKVLNETSLNKNQDKLIEVFDKERNFYINFITLISIVLSIIGIAPVVYGLFEKNENIKLREELENVKKQYDLELGKLKLIDFFNAIQRISDALKKDEKILLAKNRQVKTYDDLEEFTISRLNKEIKKININLLYEENMNTLAIKIYNFISAIIYYQVIHFNMNAELNENNQVIIVKCEIIKNLFIHIQTLLSPKQFEDLIKNIMDLPDCTYDFTGLSFNNSI